ncbi:MAG: Maf family protein [Lachnospiraceae bacterium]|nr:Maf family protein [Lachnospiraceae bacterium]
MKKRRLVSGEEIVLASASPRRKELLDRSGIAYIADPADADETIQAAAPEKAVLELSRRKAEAGLKKHREAVVIGADTIVALDGRILGKPRSEEEAVRMLASLSGRSHEVFTGVAILWNLKDGRKGYEGFFERTRVEMFENSGDEILRYVRTGEPFDKAGAYGIQGRGTLLVRSIDGNYDNVVGLPLARLVKRLEELFVFMEAADE